MSDEQTEAGVSGEAWREFCRALEQAGQLVLDNSTDELDRVEGFRYLSRLARGALESNVERTSSSFPVVATIPSMVKIGCDNPDALYQTINVSGAHTYRITGNRGTVNYLGIGAYSGGFAASAGALGSQGYIVDNDPDPQRELSILVSAEEPAKLGPDERWLQMGEVTTQITIRQFYLDRRVERPATLAVECLDPETPTPPPLDGATLARQLQQAGRNVEGIAQYFLSWVNDHFLARPNTLDFNPGAGGPGGGNRSWGDPNQTFRHGYWTLEPGQAIVVEVPQIRAYYWNFQLNNIWEESLDYRFHQVTVNSKTVTCEPDGSARIVVADEDPGVGNWIDTAGHRHGTWGLRYNQVVEDMAPTCTVVDLAELRSG